MRKLAYLLLILVLIWVIFASRQNYQKFFASLKPCDNPITYSIGSVDPRFNLTQDKVQQYAKEAANLWNSQRQKPVFTYSDSALISIDMVFDQRQGQANKINQLDSQLDTQKQKLEEETIAHRAKAADFKKKLQDFNQRVDAINAQGGASSQEEYDKLVGEQQELAKEADELNNEAKRLNISSENFNVGVTQINSEIQKFNKNLVLKPEEGLFLPAQNKIEIYFNNNKDELVHTLAHEFGHAIGIGHLQNQKAIMYPYSTNVTKLSPDDIAELEKACQEKPILEGISEKFQYFSQTIINDIGLSKSEN